MLRERDRNNDGDGAVFGNGGDVVHWRATATHDEEDCSDGDWYGAAEPRQAAEGNDDDRPELLTACSQSEIGDEEEDERQEAEACDDRLDDSLALALATGRTGVDELLDSMFTERTEDGEVESEEAERFDTERAASGDDDDDSRQNTCQDSWRGGHCEHREEQIDSQRAVPEDEEGDTWLDQPTSESERHTPSIPAQPEPYGTISTSCASYSDRIQHALEATNQSSSATRGRAGINRALRIIAFDVGGTLFRCKESLIRKYPLKRLNQVISCGCEKIGRDTFFIDRNPQHFEVILDWYRTGKYVRHPHVSEDALQEDAKYFDLFEELFPEKILPLPQIEHLHRVVPTKKQPPPRIPPRPHHHEQHQQRLTSHAKLVTTEAESIVPANSKTQHQAMNSAHPVVAERSIETMRFCKTEHRRIEADGAPVVFMVRKHEHLRVASVQGRGKLLVRVCDATGLQVVHVPSAVLFDSQSHFYLCGGRAKLQHCLLPGGHTYTFWMELDPAAASNTTSVASHKPTNSAMKHELGVEFALLSSFRCEEQLIDALDEELRSLVSGGGGGGGGGSSAGLFVTPPQTAATDEGTSSSSSFSPYMFLPPRYQQQLQQMQHTQAQDAAQAGDGESEPRNTRYDATALQNCSERDAIAQQLFSQSNQHHTRQKVFAPSQLTSPSGETHKKSSEMSTSSSQHTKIPPSAIKRNGATIVSGASSKIHTHSNNNNSSSTDPESTPTKQSGKVTVYRHAQLKIEQSPRGFPAASPRSKPAKRDVAAKYHEHQPRLFR